MTATTIDSVSTTARHKHSASEKSVPNSAAIKASVESRVANLRSLAETEPQAAQDAVWAWSQRLGAELPTPAAATELDALFAAGQPADVDGQTDGLLLGWLNPSDLDRNGSNVLRVARTVVQKLGVLPWLGKKFDKAAGRGTNTMSAAAPLLGKLIAPKYKMRRVGKYWEGFDMLNFIEESVVSPGTQVLVLDYENIGSNPWPINQIRDEAVEIVPGTYLGAKLWHQSNGYRQLAWWASRSPLASAE